MNIFGNYADYYDYLYSDKDYRSECLLISRLFKKYHHSPVRSILDLGCGTGNHSFILNRMGFEILGIDRSTAMLRKANNKLSKISTDTRISFKRADIRNFNLKQKFDTAIMMFAVLGYQLENQDVMNTLKSVRRHLKKDGLFIFDAWFGPAVLNTRPANKIKEIKIDNRKISRVTHTDLDILNHKCIVHFKTKETEKGREINSNTETHAMRYFFPKEIEFYLKSTRFKQLFVGTFPDLKIPDESSWNVIWIAQSA